MNNTTQKGTKKPPHAPYGDTLPSTADELYIYLWRKHSAIRNTSLTSAIITAMALNQDAEIVANLGLLLDMDAYQRSQVTSEELMQKLDETMRAVRPDLFQDCSDVVAVNKCRESQGLIAKLIEKLKGGSNE